MKLTISKSKNSESYYISKSYINNQGKSTTKTVRKLGTLKELSETLGTDRNGVIAWAKEQVRSETEKYKADNEAQSVMVSFKANEQMSYNTQKFFIGGYLFPQSIYYDLKLDYICKRIKSKYSFEYDLNAILSDLIYTRILDPNSKRSSYNTAMKFLEPPPYELHDVYRALSVLADECDFIQSEVYKNSHFVTQRNDKILYYDCTNYYFEIEQEEGNKKYGKSKENRPNPIIQMGMFTDGRMDAWTEQLLVDLGIPVYLIEQMKHIYFLPEKADLIPRLVELLQLAWMELQDDGSTHVQNT